MCSPHIHSLPSISGAEERQGEEDKALEELESFVFTTDSSFCCSHSVHSPVRTATAWVFEFSPKASTHFTLISGKSFVMPEERTSKRNERERKKENRRKEGRRGSQVGRRKKEEREGRKKDKKSEINFVLS